MDRLAPGLPLIQCFHLIPRGGSPPFRPLPPLDFTFGGRVLLVVSVAQSACCARSPARNATADQRMCGCARANACPISVSSTGVTRRGGKNSIDCLLSRCSASGEHVYRYHRVHRAVRVFLLGLFTSPLCYSGCSIRESDASPLNSKYHDKTTKTGIAYALVARLR